jgi:hypothetical protein
MLTKIIKMMTYLLVFVVLGLPIPWAFSLTINRVIPLIEVSKNVDKYQHAKFIVDKVYFHHGSPGVRTTGTSNSWIIKGRVNGKVPAFIPSNGLYPFGAVFESTEQLESVFPVNREIDVLYNPTTDSSSKLQILGNYKDLEQIISHGIKKYLLITYLPIIADFIILAAIVRHYKRYKRQAVKENNS